MKSKICYFILLSFVLSACQPALDRQPKLKPYAVSDFFENKSAMRDSVPGTVPLGKKPWVPAAINKELLLEGQKNFNIYCSVCHGYTGHGDGMAVRRGFPAPMNLQILQALPPQGIMAVIGTGTANMPSFSSKLSEADRWAIANYVKALQLREHFPRNLLSESDLKHLSEAP